MAGTYAKYSPQSGGGGGGGGITSINGNTMSAQTIAGGTDIGVVSSVGTTTISFTGSGDFANTTLSNLTSPTAINQILYGGSLDSSSLLLSSTSNATKNFVGVVDGSILAAGENVVAGLAAYTTAGDFPPAQLYVSDLATDDSISDNNVLFETWGSQTVFALAGTGGTSSSPSYLSSGQSAATIFFTTWGGSTPNDQNIATIGAVASQTQSGSAYGTELLLKVVPTSSTGLVTAVTVTGTGTTMGGVVAALGSLVARGTSVGTNVGLAVDESYHIHYDGSGTGVTNTLQPGAGTSPSFTLTSTSAGDSAGQFTLTTGSGAWASGAQVIVGFALPYNSAPMVYLTPASTAAGANLVGWYVTSTSTGFTINFTNADTASHAYTFNYTVIET
jgi:hypothetical protein